jgi:hypothetical protein
LVRTGLGRLESEYSRKKTPDWGVTPTRERGERAQQEVLQDV